jgi:hypothetical protein
MADGLENGAAMSREVAAEAMQRVQQWRIIIIVKRQTVDTALLQQARSLAKDAFGQMGPEGEDALDRFIRDQCEQWVGKLTAYKALAETGSYPGPAAINDSLSFLVASSPRRSRR